MAESDSARRLRQWEEAQNRLAPGESAIDRMLSDMAFAKTGWHRVRGEDGSVSVVLPNVPNYRAGSPEAKAQEDAWEMAATAMHDAQKAITLPDKPTDTGTRGRYSAVAAFEAQYADEPIPNFADTEHATGKHKTIKRG